MPNLDFAGKVQVRVTAPNAEPMVGTAIYPSLALEGLYVIADPVVINSEGQATIKYPLNKTTFASLQIQQTGYLPREIEWKMDEIPDAITIHLVPDPKITEAEWK